MTVQEEVNEALDNSVDNAGPNNYTRDAGEVAREILEYTTIDGVTWESNQEYENWVEKVTSYVAEWQSKHKI